eukprot:CAMPEP_0185728952 /NCGR_PEP_ID=MMETSP1171-20130828/4384_1 /TAXON_ID=374046 /ORGANISM="Helicotheca tamensis, Strain CCMP826" /LENGTH=174 /DNA_ID=CAMNT_0028397709 /DNA_START=48 /DNA_END=572 /DNA_ORIENTATION=+
MQLPARALASLMLLQGSLSFTPGHSPKRSFTTARPMTTEAMDVNTVEAVGTQIEAFIVPGVAALAAGAAAIFAPKLGGKAEKKSTVAAEPEPEPIDVSIPYDATALLAYESWREENEKGEFNAETFEGFSKIYYEMSVGTATAKKLKRDAEGVMAKADAEFAKCEKLAESLKEL